ncbi:hypothetical protein RISK_001972 [Rhodopirellula islandica]|uniref:Uncharacterized protein n=1 Tax=Rhodopirellula islandica TaxID=595434 RepID=A0A0J1BHU9_RHOIS|nr:hypothetical protein RISK_001972 [Rhodopirellula islandica]
MSSTALTGNQWKPRRHAYYRGFAENVKVIFALNSHPASLAGSESMSP